jgi:alpha-1,6-mannosyltransferase
MQAFGAWLSRHRYLILATATVLALGIQTRHQQWSTDMWLHASVVRELMRHPFDPSSPVVSLDAPHSDYSPYTLSVALFGRAFGLDALGALSVAAIGNAVLLLVGLRAFVGEITGDRVRAPFWALLFTLLLWGPTPWRWSGFLHLNAIGFGLPYPSAFATGLGLLALAWLHRWLDRGGTRLLVGFGVSTLLVGLTHPLTAVWYLLVATALLVDALPIDRAHVIGLGGAAVLVIGAALVWPYYPAWRVAGTFSSEASFTVGHHALYNQVLIRIWPALLGLPPLWGRLRKRWRDPLVLVFAGSASIYVAGWITSTWWFGRMLVPIVLVLHIALADWVAHQEVSGRVLSATRPYVHPLAIGLVVLLMIGSFDVRAGAVRAVPRTILPASLAKDVRLKKVSHRYRFLEHVIAPDDVVVAYGDDTIYMTAFTGRLLTSRWTTPFVDRRVEAARAADQGRFLTATTSPAERKRIIRRYDIRAAVLPTGIVEALTPQFREVGGRNVITRHGLTVVAFDPNAH